MDELFEIELVRGVRQFREGETPEMVEVRLVAHAGRREELLRVLEAVRAGEAALRTEERERACRIVRSMCPECEDGVADVVMGPSGRVLEATECQRCGEVVRAIRGEGEDGAKRDTAAT